MSASARELAHLGDALYPETIPNNCTARASCPSGPLANCRRWAEEELAKHPYDSVKRRYRWLQHCVENKCRTQAVEGGER